MIEARNLTKFYGPTRSLHDVSFRVAKGEVVGFLGPNGAGKSTTIRILTGLARATAGSAAIGGFDVQRDHVQVRQMIGYCPEQAPLYGDMTLGAFLEFIGGVKGLGRKQARREMERVTALVNLTKERPRLLRNLSKGTRQRAVIAQALVGDPEVLLLDEPTAGLDPSQISDIRALILGFRGRRTVLVSTHILSEVEATASRIVVIAEGQVRADGTPQALTQQAGAALRVVARGDESHLRQLLKKHGFCDGNSQVTHKEDGSLEAICGGYEEDGARQAALSRAMVEAGLELVELRVDRARLEDVFFRAIGRRP